MDNCITKILILSAGLIFSPLNSMAVEGYSRPFSPDPTRFEDSMRGFRNTDEQRKPPEHAIVACGSSSIARWHSRISVDLEGLTIIPRGLGGSQLSDIIYFAEDIILKYNPRAVILYEGDNDIAGGKSPEHILSDLKFLVDYCRTKQPDLRFYVLSIKPSISRWQIWQSMASTNALMKSYCEETVGLTYIDVATPLLNPEGNHPRGDIFISDNLHLNSNGYDLWAQSVRPILIEKEAKFEQ